MDKFTKLEGVAAPLKMINVDTDMIIPKQYLKTTADSGNPRAHGFCPNCGTPIFATTPGEGKQALYGVRVGILRQRNEITPKRQVWFRSSQPWTMHMDALPKTEKGS